MSNIYPREFNDIQNDIAIISNLYVAWMDERMNDRVYASKMGDMLEVLKKNMASLKAAYRREARSILEMAGSQVP